MHKNANLPQGLVECRKKIDTIDTQIVELLERRIALGLEIGALKAKAGLPISVAEREDAVLRNIENASKGDLPQAMLHDIFKKIIACTKELEYTHHT